MKETPSDHLPAMGVIPFDGLILVCHTTIPKK